MKRNNLYPFVFLLCLIGCLSFTGCDLSGDKEVTPTSSGGSSGGGSGNNNGSGGAGSAMYGYWKRADGQAWLSVSSSGVGMCVPTIFAEAQKCVWNGGDNLRCNINGTTRDFELKKSGSQLVLIPITDGQTHNPAYYNSDNEFPCNGSGGNGGGGNGGGGNGNGGNGGGGNGGGGSTTGQATFWTSSDLKCGNITVQVSGKSGVITGYYSNTTPDCGSSRCATFTLAPGTYNFSANCSSYKWNGSIKVTAGGCSLMRLH